MNLMKNEIKDLIKNLIKILELKNVVRLKKLEI